MVSGGSVSAHADVPIASRVCASVRIREPARTWGTLASRLRCGERVIQVDHVLLVQSPPTQGSHSDVEGAVLPEHVVIQLWIRGLPASAIYQAACTTPSRSMAAGAGDAPREVRHQGGAVLHADQP